MGGRVVLKHRVLSKTFFLFVCAGWIFHLASTAAPQTHDYLTEEEIEQLREAQEPHLRMNVLTGILNKRFEKVRLAGTHKVSAKEETP